MLAHALDDDAFSNAYSEKEAVPRPRTRDEVEFFPASRSDSCELIRMGPKMSLSSEITVDQRTFVLARPLRVDVNYTASGEVFASHKTLPVSGYGRSLDEALAGFNRSFAVQWDMLVDCDESELAPSAIRARNSLKEAVSRIN